MFEINVWGFLHHARVRVIARKRARRITSRPTEFSLVGFLLLYLSLSQLVYEWRFKTPARKIKKKITRKGSRPRPSRSTMFKPLLRSCSFYSGGSQTLVRIHGL